MIHCIIACVEMTKLLVTDEIGAGYRKSKIQEIIIRT